MFTDRIILVTGGAGSFGKAMVSKFLELGAGEVRVFSRSCGSFDNREREEASMGNGSDKFVKDSQYGGKNDGKIKFIRGDIRDREAVTGAMTGVDFVVHAAAMKDVHGCERDPQGAMEINVTGTMNVVAAAREAGVSKVVVVSTDKACFPAGAMGLTKALMERMVLAECRGVREAESALMKPANEKEINGGSKTTVSIVRFGNLMGSAGTVIPLFVRQAREGRELTVTNPDMTRFMMTVADAVDLVLIALRHGQNGDIVIERAQAASIRTLVEGAVMFVSAASSKPSLKIIGARPGEKLYETMATEEEMSRAVGVNSDKKLYLRIPLDGALCDDLAEEFNSHNSPALSAADIAAIIRKLGI